MPHRWRTVADHPAYEVSDHGAVRRRLPGKRTWPGRRLNPCRNKMGYLYTSMDGDRVFIHVLVCEAFRGPRPSRAHDAAHDNGRNRDNCWTNLRWKTKAQNDADKRKHGRVRGQRNPAAILTATQVRRIRSYRGKKSGVAVGKMFGISDRMVSRIQLRQNWTHIL